MALTRPKRVSSPALARNTHWRFRTNPEALLFSKGEGDQLKEDREPLTSLNELLGDQRLKRIFSSENRDCAIQLWILRIRRGADIENRIVYGQAPPI